MPATIGAKRDDSEEDSEMSGVVLRNHSTKMQSNVAKTASPPSINAVHSSNLHSPINAAALQDQEGSNKVQTELKWQSAKAWICTLLKLIL